jgi:hypothetical protein
MLGGIARLLEAQPNLNFLIEGHTDNKTFKVNNTNDNWTLSVNRAAVVAKILQNKYKIDPKRMIASMRGQLQKVFESIQAMETIYYKLLQNPQDFGGIIPALKRNSSSDKFVKLAKFEKVEDSKKEIKESDEYLENYYNNEMDYAPYGTALEHPQENRNKLTDEIKVHSSSKFKKI